VMTYEWMDEVVECYVGNLGNSNRYRHFR